MIRTYNVIPNVTWSSSNDNPTGSHHQSATRKRAPPSVTSCTLVTDTFATLLLALVVVMAHTFVESNLVHGGGGGGGGGVMIISLDMVHPINDSVTVGNNGVPVIRAPLQKEIFGICIGSVPMMTLGRVQKADANGVDVCHFQVVRSCVDGVRVKHCHCVGVGVAQHDSDNDNIPVVIDQRIVNLRGVHTCTCLFKVSNNNNNHTVTSFTSGRQHKEASMNENTVDNKKEEGKADDEEANEEADEEASWKMSSGCNVPLRPYGYG